MLRKMTILALCLALCALTACGVAQLDQSEAPQALEEPMQPEPEETALFRYGRSFLNQEAKLAYDGLLALAETYDHQGRVKIPSGMTEEEIRTLLGYFMDDNPAFYWLTPSIISESGGGARYIAFQYAAGMNADKVRSRLEHIKREAAVLLEGLDGSSWDKVLTIHDRLAEHITYDMATDADNMGNLYGGLINRAGVCDAYTKSFQYLMGELGIPCINVRGSNDRGRSHAWNAVELDGHWYYVDVTWDDKETLRHNYLGISSEEISREHYWDTTQYPRLPESSMGEYDYYKQTGALIEKGNENSLINAMAEAFAGQLMERGTTGDEVFLEVKIAGTKLDYHFAKEIFIENVFVIRNRMEELMEEGGAAIRIRKEETVSCNYNDAMYVLSFFPAVEQRG